jgi:type I restriction enzyme R subunit
MSETPSYLEDRDSQVPALRLLQQMDYSYLPPKETVRQRKGSVSSVVLQDILLEQLQEINCIEYKGQEYRFSPNNIERAVREINEVLD